MGFLSGFGAAQGLAAAAGVAQGVGEGMANQANQQAQAYANQKAIVDKVAAEQNQIDAKATQVVRTKESLKGQYGIDDDLAYNLATDPSFDKMDPDKRADYIQRLKPTGNYTQGTQATGGTPIPGTGYKTSGFFGMGSKEVPPVPSAITPGEPSRQIYQPEPPKPNYRSMYGAFPPPRDPDQANAQATLAQLDVPGVSPGSITPDLITKAYGKDPKEAKSQAMSKTMDLIASGHINSPENAEAVYEGLGGKKKDFDWTTIQHQVKDPVFQQKIDTLNGIGVPDALSKKIVIGAIHVTHDPASGQAQAIDLTTGQLLDPAMAAAVAAHPDVLPGGVVDPAQSNTTSTPQQGKPAQPAQQPPGPPGGKNSTLPPTQPQQNSAASPPQQTNAAGAQQPTQPVKPTPQAWVTKPVYDMVSKELNSVPQTLAKIHYVQQLVTNNPMSVGVPGHAIEQIGGPMVTLGNLFSSQAGDSVNKWLNVSKTSEFKSAMDDLRASLPRPITQDQTGGRISNYEREQISGIISDEKWHDTPQSVQANLGYVENLMYRTVAGDLNAIYPAPPDLSQNQQAQASRYTFLTKQLNLSGQDAYRILATEIGAKQGQGLK
jgi:hypothetical protein